MKLSVLSRILGYTFKDPDLLQAALTHRSLQGKNIGNNYERLEFLGDRVLGLVVAELLYETFPEETEGGLSRRHAQLVRKETLAEIATTMGLHDHISMTSGEKKSGGRLKPSIQSDVCEAVIAALYLEGGLDVVKKFIKTHWMGKFHGSIQSFKDAKSSLQEWAQGRHLPNPTYTVTEQIGKIHSPTFIIEVRVKGYPPAQAKGPSKREAEQLAARALLERLESERTP